MSRIAIRRGNVFARFARQLALQALLLVSMLVYSTSAFALDPPDVTGNTVKVPYNAVDFELPLLLSGGLADYVTVTNTAMLRGTATVVGTKILYTPQRDWAGTNGLTYNATNAAGTSKLASVNILIDAPVPVLTPVAGALPNGKIGVAYSQSITASQAKPPYTYSIKTGTLPAGLTFDAASGTISGAPIIVGKSDFTYEVKDGYASKASGAYSISIVPEAPTISSISPATGETTGGTFTTITGQYFSDATAVTFGGTAVAYTVVSDTMISATTPAHSVGAADVAVTTAGGTATLANGFTYVAPLSIDAHPSNSRIATGSNTTFSATASNATGYQWLVNTGSGFTNVSNGGVYSGATTPTLSITGATAGMNGYLYRLRATGTAPPFVNSNAATLTVITPPDITGQPSNSTIVAAANTSFSITATDAYSYQWQVDTGSGFSDISNGGVYSGATTRTLSIAGATASMDGYRYKVVVTGFIAPNATSSAVTLTVNPPAPTVSDVTATVAANSSANPITLSLGGGAATSVAVTTAAAHGTATASGTSISYTPTAGYSGPDSFTYTATNISGTPPVATVTITVTKPTLALAPAAGSLGTGKIGDAYGQTFTVSGGQAPYSYAVSAGALPAGVTLDASTGALSGTPTAAGTANFTVTATDANGASGSAGYSIAINPLPPVVNAVSVTVAANSSANPIVLDITGPADSVAVVSPAAHGTATASGTSITYTPSAGYSGSDSFTYTATNASGTSAPATVTITVSAPSFAFAPAAGDLPAGKIGKAYDRTITASGGTAPYKYEVTAGTLPAGLSLDPTTGRISGTPSAADKTSFTVTVTDANGGTGTASYSLAIVPDTVLSFNPAGGDLPQAMAGEAYTASVTVKGGTGTVVYKISGPLPDGMVFNVSTGELTGPLKTDAKLGDYRFTITATDGTGATGSATFTLTVVEQTITAADKEVTVPAGSTPNNVYLNREATGGPFTGAAIAYVEPSNAGTAEIIEGELAASGEFRPVGYYLKFTPDPAFSGTAKVGYKLTSSIGTSNTGTVTYRIALDTAKVASDIDNKVRSFVASRQSLLSSSVQVPGLLERRRAASTSEPVTTTVSPSAEGAQLGFSTSLAQIKAARAAADGTAQNVTLDPALDPFNVWATGSLLFHNRDENDGKWGSFGLLSLGTDYLINDKALIGLSFHYDRMTDPTDEDAELTGNGWLAGPYASFEIGKGVFLDTSLLYGGSANDIDTHSFDGTFDTRRWMADTSLKGQWILDDVTTLTPKLRAVYFNESVDDYGVTNGTDAIDLKGFTEEQLRLSAGFDLERVYELEGGLNLTPAVGVDVGYSAMDGNGMFGSLSADLRLSNETNWDLDFSLLLNLEGDGEKSAGGKVGVSVQF